MSGMEAYIPHSFSRPKPSKPWFKACREQAGAQRGRGCTEHMLTIRLLTDYAKQKKQKLFVTFVDFSQAYDEVPRDLLLRVLKRLGCGSVMLGAIAAMYRVPESVLGSAVFATTVGVCQGSLTSCLLYILFVNDLVKSIKENCEDDGFLSWLHILDLKDDSVAGHNERMLHKLRLLKNYCDDYGIMVNEEKTKFFRGGKNLSRYGTSTYVWWGWRCSGASSTCTSAPPSPPMDLCIKQSGLTP